MLLKIEKEKRKGGRKRGEKEGENRIFFVLTTVSQKKKRCEICEISMYDDCMNKNANF